MKRDEEMRILAIVSGQYGRRHVDNLRAHGPDDWEIHVWQAPAVLPPVIDDPEDHLPDEFPQVKLILSFAEHKGVAELLPEIAEMTSAHSVLVAVDDANWLPRGLARQLRGWLADLGVTCVTPKPLCSLTESDYGIAFRERIPYDDATLAAFARHFGRPNLTLTVDPETRTIVAVDVERDAVCGCARAVAAGLIGVSVDKAEEKAGLLHHHYPCLASMQKLDEFNHDTLMHVSGHILKDQVGEQVKPFKKVRYIRPRIGKRSS
jgi:hypothetical protein